MEETKQITKAQDMLDILEPIPDGAWCVKVLTDGMGRCCALGHINKAVNGDPLYRTAAPVKLSRKFLKEKHNTDDLTIADVNNAPTVNGYTEDTPKARVLHLLRDMIADGY